MKTIKKDDQILRLSDEEAHNRVVKFGWNYIPKQVWKDNIRNKK